MAAAYEKALELARRGERLKALGWIDEAIDEPSDRPRALALKANLLLETGAASDALSAAERATREAPELALGWRVHADALNALARSTEALGSAETAVRLDPNYATAHASRAAALRALARYEEALSAFDEALRLQPEAADVLVARSGVRLLLGDFEGGWRDYAARWRRPVPDTSASFVTPLQEKLSFPLGPEALAGRRVLVAADQGVGDQIMFASVLPDASSRAEQVTCICDRRLVRVLSHSMPGVRFFDPRDGVPNDFGRFDMVVALGDLAAAFRHTAEDFPGSPYLRPTPLSVDRWAAKLGARAASIRVGLSWRGGTASTNASGRSIPLAALSPLLEMPGCEYVSLQYGEVTDELSQLSPAASAALRVFGAGDIDDFDDLAGLVQNLDLVISVQTALVHLCGAIGKDCQVLVPAQPEWRYGANGQTMPWYGSVRLHRQRERGDWLAPLEAVRGVLTGVIAPST